MSRENMRPGHFGGYIFISHSHDDIKKVRLVRNYLESRDIEPILFYLRCMKDGTETEKTELWNLIRREIDERDWFLYLDSDNARKSEWVQKETEYAERTKEGYILRIDLDQDMEIIQEIIETVGRAMRVYLSYDPRDRELFSKLRDEFEHQDFAVWYGKYNHYGEDDWRNMIEDTMESVYREGCFIPILTETGLRSGKVFQEIKHAASRVTTGFMFPIITEEATGMLGFLEPELKNYLSRMQFFVYRNDQDIEGIVREIRNTLIKHL